MQPAKIRHRLRSAVRGRIRRIGFDIIPYPVPEYLGLREHLASLFSRLGVNCVLDVGAHHGEYGRMLVTPRDSRRPSALRGLVMGY